MQIGRETILQIAREEGMLPPSGPYFAEYEAATLSFATRIARQAAEAARQWCERECFKLIEISSRNAVHGDHFEVGREAGHSECIDAIRAALP